MSSEVIQVLVIAFLISIVYCIVLERIRDWYSPDYVVVTVIIGFGFIIATCREIELRGIDLTWQWVFWIALVWGTPVTAWQVIQSVLRWMKRRRRRANHATKD